VQKFQGSLKWPEIVVIFLVTHAQSETSVARYMHIAQQI